MRRGIVIGFIVCYLLVLGFGIFSHALGYKSTDHVGMYYIIWTCTVAGAGTSIASICGPGSQRTAV